MAQRSDGTWAASRVGDFGGRQGAGKSGTAIVRIFGGIFLAGEHLQIYTAHEFPTSNEIFIRIGGILESYDDFAGLVLHERRAHGDQGFELKGPKGSEITGKRRLLFKTRTGKSGRGFAKANLILYDEAQHLLPEHVAGSAPAKLANPNSQSWYSGSGGLAKSVKAWEMRRQALTGSGRRLSYTEHTAETVSVDAAGRIHCEQPDPDDRDGWARANPGLGRWVTEESMEVLRDELGELFSREGLCIWEPEPMSDGARPIELDTWAGLAQISQVDSHFAWSLVVSDDRRWSTIGFAGRRADGMYHVEVGDNRPTLGASDEGTLIDRCVAVWEQERVPVRIHATAPEGSHIAELRERGVEVEELSSADVARATGQLIDAANGRNLRHVGQRTLDASLERADVKVSSSGASTWVATSGDISPLKAVTVALGGVAQVGEVDDDSVYEDRGMVAF